MKHNVFFNVPKSNHQGENILRQLVANYCSKPMSETHPTLYKKLRKTEVLVFPESILYKYREQIQNGNTKKILKKLKNNKNIIRHKMTDYDVVLSYHELDEEGIHIEPLEIDTKYSKYMKDLSKYMEKKHKYIDNGDTYNKYFKFSIMDKINLTGKFKDNNRIAVVVYNELFEFIHVEDRDDTVQLLIGLFAIDCIINKK